MEQDITALILKTAFEKFGITAVKPFQLLVMQRIIEQESRNYAVRHQIVILPTGTGKSLCFLLPAVLCNGITIIVYPLLALMNDQLAFLNLIFQGKVVMEGVSKEILIRDNILNKIGLKVPFMYDLSVKLMDYNLLGDIELDKDRMVDQLWK